MSEFHRSIFFEESAAPGAPGVPSVVRPVTRRQLLQTMGTTGLALIGGAALAACGGSGSGATAVSVTFYTNAYPTDSMPSLTDQKKDPATKAYADTLQKWLNKNPGVTIKHSATNIWDTTALTTAVSAGTAPTWYMGNVLGGWDDLSTRIAFARGLAADVTALDQKYGIDQRLNSFVVPLWHSWNMQGKYYAIPNTYIVGNGIYFRRDLIQQAGMQEPTPSWTWEDFRKIAKATTKGKVKGAVLQSWGLSWNVSANQIASNATAYTSMGPIPSPNTSWHWRYDLMTKLNEMKSIVDNYRGMFITDKSLLSDITYVDDNCVKAFARGDTALMANNSGFFVLSPDDPDSVVQLARRLNKSIEELVGWISHPIGTNGAFGNTQAQMGLGSFAPQLQRNPVALTKAFDFFVYMIMGQGAIDPLVATYQATKDLQRVYTSIPPLTSNMNKIPGIPGTPADAWGQKYMQAVQAATQIPLIPNPSQYFPTEKNAGLTSNAFNDAFNGMSYSTKDVGQLITTLQNTVNQQAASLSSSVSSADFTKGAKNFYSALNDFWQKNAPDFYTNDFQPWYQQKLLPALGG